MFETLDPTVFARAETAYGPADGVLDQLHDLDDLDPAVSRSALYDLHAGLYHQDQFCAATPLIIPYLLEVLTLDVPIRTELVLLLASMQPLGRSDSFGSFGVPYTETLYEDGQATIAAIQHGRPVIEQLLEVEDVELRSAAAWLLAGCVPADPAPLARRLVVETDDDVRVSLHLALAAMGQDLGSQADDGSRAADIACVLAAERPLSEDDAAAFARLLAAPPWPKLHAETGMPTRVAARELLRLGRDEARTFELLRDAWHVQQARPSIASPHDWIRVDHPSIEAYNAEHAEARFGTPLPVLLYMLAWAAFAVDAQGKPVVDLTQLSEPQRWTLEHVDIGAWRGGVAGQVARLGGDFPLDDVVTALGVTSTIAAQLETARETPELDLLFAELVRALPPQRLFDVAMLVMDSDNSHVGCHPKAYDAVMRWCATAATDDRLLAWLTTHPKPTYTQGRYGLHAYRDATPKRVPPPAFDDLVAVDLQSSRPDEKAWVSTFPSPRREQLLLAAYGTFWTRVPGLFDPSIMAELVLDAFMAPTCHWKEDHARGTLEIVPHERLLKRCAGATGGQARVVAQLVAKWATRTTPAHFTLTLSGALGAFTLALDHVGGDLSLTHETPSLTSTNPIAPVLEVLRKHPRAIVTIAGDASPDDIYRLQLAVGASPIEVRVEGGATLNAGI